VRFGASYTLNVSLVCHSLGMADLDRRSEDRRAQIVVRMSHAERETLHRVAEAEGTTITDLVRDRMADLIGASR
jgi:hypothetical protein